MQPTIAAFIQAKTWTESQRIFEQHPELLTDEADILLGQLIQAAQAQDNEDAQRTFKQRRTLLRRCREVGIAQTFAELPSPHEREAEAKIPPQFQSNLQPALQGVQYYHCTGDLTALNAAIAA